MRKKYLIFLIFVILSVSLVYLFLDSNSNVSDYSSVSVSEVMSSNNNEGFRIADEIRDFIFPDDHGPHNDYKLEWWYYTGNLKAVEGKHFAYQFTIFRNALSKDTSKINSDFATNQLYFAHFGLTDVEADKHYHFEKFARGVEGLAKAEFNPMIIKIEDWIVSGKYENGDFKKPVFRIKAKNEILAIDLELIPSKDMVLHGDRGLSQKSNEKGNASYYYSFTRLNTHGLISLNGKNHKVMGNSWMDREWSTSALSKGQTGWDWFSIQLDDTSEIMYFRLRDSINNTNFAKGTLVFANSEYINLKSDDIILETLESTKLESGTVYPYKWRMKIPEYKIDLNIETMIKEQEMKLSVKYYEGCIKLSGNKNNKIINGYGFVELTGYGDKL